MSVNSRVRYQRINRGNVADGLGFKPLHGLAACFDATFNNRC